jgi:hypothetical protein
LPELEDVKVTQKDPVLVVVVGKGLQDLLHRQQGPPVQGYSKQCNMELL